MTERLMTYSKSGQVIWQKTLPRDDVFYDVDFVGENILALVELQSCRRGFIKYKKDGSITWKKCDVYGGTNSASIDRRFLRHDIIAIDSFEGEPHFRTFRSLSLIDGKLLPIDGMPLEYFEDRILTDVTTYDISNYAYEPSYSLFNMSNVGFKIFSVAGKPDPYNFPTPPRPNCRSYDHVFYPFILDNLKDARIFTKSKASGEYIYAHRADGCGQFTYKFHWTDPAHPDPEILPGWL